MDIDDREDNTIYEVVMNHEEQYSIWPGYKGDPPPGWKKVGKSGKKEECLDYIKDVWTDMKPLSLRKAMEEMEKRRPEMEEEARKREEVEKKPKDPRDDLVAFLSEGNHPVEVGLRPENTAKLFKEAIDRGYVHIKYTDTRGGTELGVRLDKETSDYSQADFEKGTGRAHLEGHLKLNYVNVRCIADIDIDTLTGHGHLERVMD